VLRCQACGRALVVGTSGSGGRTFHNYRCPPAGDCDARASISATVVEGHIAGIVRAELADATGHSSAMADAHELAHRTDLLDAELAQLIEALTTAGVMTEPASIAAVAAKRAERDDVRAQAERSSRAAGVSSVLLGRDWDELSGDARRELIAAIVDRVDVAQGRGLERVDVRLAREQPALAQ
jgi:hypothetical protein